MAAISDFSSDVAQVRLLIGDIDDTARIFNDSAIAAFIALALDNSVKRAAAQALLTIAVNEVLVQKRIKLLDLSTDGPAEAEALRNLAKDLMAQADMEEVDGAFDWAEMLNTPAQRDEFLMKERYRGLGY
jgi:hypothetical protein